MIKMVAVQLQEEWETLVNHHAVLMTRTWISSSFLRPFLFFIAYLSIRHQRIRTRDVDCIRHCFKTLLESINSTGTPFFYLIILGFLLHISVHVSFIYPIYK